MILVGQGIRGGCGTCGKGEGGEVNLGSRGILKPAISMVELWVMCRCLRHLEPWGLYITAACVSECHHPLQWWKSAIVFCMHLHYTVT